MSARLQTLILIVALCVSQSALAASHKPPRHIHSAAPAAGETMPRYDKMEFKMLGGQIVCEGVIVEAPAQGSQRSFTRLAEPRNPERARELMRERQAALA